MARRLLRNRDASLTAEFRRHGLPHNLAATLHIAAWAYDQAERAGWQLWLSGRERLEPLDPSWRKVLPHAPAS